MTKKKIIIYLGCLCASFLLQAADLNHQAKLQRGAKLFMNYCSGCHSLRYLRYNRLAEDLGLINFDKQVDANLVSNLMFTSAKIVDPIEISMPASDARQWFGTVPPDLSLTARERGASWIYSYLIGFYPDSGRPFGSNNVIVPNTAMPNVLDPLASQASLNNNLDDLLTFLVYVAEPAQLIRYRIGWIVLLFLGVFCLVAYLLKKIYWKKSY